VGGGRRAVLLVFLLLAAVSVSLALRAGLAPPRDTVFVGTFYYVDDFYNYLSYVEQAERGAFVFRNKLAPEFRPRQPGWLGSDSSPSRGHLSLIGSPASGLAASSPSPTAGSCGQAPPSRRSRAAPGLHRETGRPSLVLRLLPDERST
jgi:hypothetical protein